MVKIAIAGGSGQVAQEVIDALVVTQKHELIILSRDASTKSSIHGLEHLSVDYHDKFSLAKALHGVHTVLSFVQLLSDPGNMSQKNLIDASISAGVKRFAPSEWGSASIEDMPWWSGKGEVREYLKHVNKNGKVLEYTLFQPGLFMNYLAFPYKTSKHVEPLNTMIDFQNCRAIIVDGHDFVISFTTVQDMAAVVAAAVEYEGDWPVIGGIRGSHLPISQILKIGEKIRGRPIVVDTVKLEDLEAGNLKSSWSLETSHSSVLGDQAAELMKVVLIGTLLGGAKNAWAVSDEFNRILPDIEFTRIEDFLAKVWEGSPRYRFPSF